MSYCASNGVYFIAAKKLFRAEVLMDGRLRLRRKFKIRELADRWIELMKRYGYAMRHRAVAV